ncbi:hypothetical protein EG329_010453 [Mollisiaceae sp. DMI_Dod_QoI]|nr:hypothetical protein EG329_010453 [Helotiales sp. DMI_Dod_QoI]
MAPGPTKPRTLISALETLPCELLLRIFQIDFKDLYAETIAKGLPLGLLLLELDKIKGREPKLFNLFQALDIVEGHKLKLYELLFTEYNKLPATVDKTTITGFNKRKTTHLMQIKNLTIIMPLSFRAQKLTLANHLETLVFDHRDFLTSDYPSNVSSSEYILPWLLAANKKTMRRVILKLPMNMGYKEHRVRAAFCKTLGFHPTTKTLRSEGAGSLVWEKSDGGILVALTQTPF